MKKDTVIYWVATIIFCLFEGVMPALTSHTDLAKEGIRHLGYPDYFRVMLTVFKVAGSIVLILPMMPHRLKEWAYAGFTFNIIAACVSHWAVDGAGVQTFFPLAVLGVLAISYIWYHKLRSQKLQPVKTNQHFITA